MLRPWPLANSHRQALLLQHASTESQSQSHLGTATHYGLDGSGSNSGGDNIFSNHPERPWGPPSLLYIVYRVSFPRVKRPGRGVDHRLPSSAEVKERVELNLYSSSRTSWPVLERTLPFTFYLHDLSFLLSPTSFYLTSLGAEGYSFM